MAGRLEGKVAIVTGAGSGLGWASAVRFAAEGAAVMCADVDGPAAVRCAAEITGTGGQAASVQVDVTDLAATEAMAGATLDAFGRIDALYANAGIAGTGSIGSTEPDVWDRVIAVNLTGVWLSNRAVIPAMERQGGGSVVNQASIGGLIGVRGIAAYAAAKAGVIGLTRQGAVEYGPAGIRFNAICPGTIPTPLVTAVYEGRAGIGSVASDTVDGGLAAAAARYPLRRLGEPDDVAAMATFLVGDESRWVTGAVFTVDGGFSAA